MLLTFQSFLFCFDECLGFFEEGEVFFVVRGFGVFDDDPLLHGSFAHGEGANVFSLEESGDSLFGQLDSYARAGTAGEGEDFLPREEGRMGFSLLFSDIGEGTEKRGEDGDQPGVSHGAISAAAVRSGDVR